VLPFEIHENAEGDLDAIAGINPQAAQDLLVILREMEENEDLNERLLTDQSEVHDRFRFQVGKFESQQRQNRNVWKMKVWEKERLLNYRILYALSPIDAYRTRCICVLAIVHRAKYNYEPNHPITQRLIEDYDDL